MPRRILVIEDNEDTRDLMGMVLEDYETKLVEDLRDLQSLKSFDPSVVFTDLTLPSSSDPDEIIGRVSELYPSVKIVLMSGRAEIREISQKHKLSYLIKPVDLDAVIAAIPFVK